MLDLRPDCEKCGRDLPPESADARICTFECTFCANCATNVLGGSCPNCGGNFSPRPIRPTALLAKYPIPLEFFKGFGAQHWMVDGQPDNVFRSFSPFASVTISFEARAGG